VVLFSCAEKMEVNMKIFISNNQRVRVLILHGILSSPSHFHRKTDRKTKYPDLNGRIHFPQFNLLFFHLEYNVG
jgi:hypothetical protein